MLWHMKADWQSDGSKSRWLRAATDQVFLTVWIFSILSSSQCIQRLWIMHETDFFFNIQTVQDKLLTESVLDKSGT